MAAGFPSWGIILVPVLLVLLTAEAGSSIRITYRELKEEDDSGKQVDERTPDLQKHAMNNHLLISGHDADDDGHGHGHGHPSSHMDPSLNVFFTINDLKIGKRMPIYFSNEDLSSSPHLLSRKQTESIPFSSSQLPYLLQFFSFSENSPQAKAMEYTLNQCELEPIKGETKFCANSLESMLDFARSALGFPPNLKVLTTRFLVKPTTLLQNYSIQEAPREILASRMIACHTMPYPYAVFYCHGQESGNRLFEISLEGDNGGRVQAAAICHMDTTQWDRDHVSFRVLKIEPGKSPVCHVFPLDNVVWVSMSA